MDINELIAETKRLRERYREASAAGWEADRAFGDSAKALHEALIAEGGWTQGQEMKLSDGSPVWISHVYFRRDDMRLVASCYRLLKSGKRSYRPDQVILLRDLLKEDQQA